MGLEARCTARIGDRTADAKALLETTELIVRADGRRVVVPFDQVRGARAEDGWLRVIWSGEEIGLELGDAAAAWARRITSPKSVLDKLGVKAGQRVALVAVDDAGFAAELAARGAELVSDRAAGCDAVFYHAPDRSALRRLPALAKRLAPAGALWVLRPKGVKAITEREVMDAGKAAGLVDVKVVSFSEQLTAEKFVIPGATVGARA